ncbi:alpha/beta hydrolase family protein [Hymenobacter jejuensis]|uniref:Alpha/beta hydrolase n=1 Tax=Hymenobacter jejuensis TaxID=2502781 RepID=A0A5B7ZZ32_9BACT|nr:alpha/beta hydrolase [Hymenobacter jejuensis]QDA59685.1 alpha/beta hydrolase [Hymenobacter jejuensis]
MHKHLYRAFLTYFFLSISLLAIAERKQTIEAAALSGQWKGPLKVPGGSLDLVVTVVPLTNGTFYAALDVPQQKISRMPVEVQLQGDEVTFRIEQAGSRFTGKLAAGGKQLTGTWQQPGLTTPIVLQHAVASAPMAKRLTRLTPPYREDEIVFPNTVAKLRLSGTLTVPAGPGPFPAVALLSDTGPQDRDAALQEYRMFGMLADFLTRRGIAVLRFDDRGVGKSGGTYASTTTADFVTDAQAAMAFLRSRNLIDPQHIGLIGHGEGANVALLAAAQPQPQAPAFVISLAGYGQPGRDVLVRQQVEIMRLIGADAAQVKAALDLHERMVDIIRQTPNDAQARGKVAGIIRLNNMDIDPVMARARAAQLTSPWSRYFLDFDPTLKLAEVQCPVLVLNGTADLQVGVQNLAILQKGLKNNRDLTVRKLTGVNHWFQPPSSEWPLVNGQQQPAFSPKALETMRSWIVARSAKSKATSAAKIRSTLFGSKDTQKLSQ